MVTTPIRKKEEIERLKQYFLQTKKYRDYTLFVVGINTALRISDLLRLKWDNVWDFSEQNYRIHICIKEQKTGKQTCIAINESCKKALSLFRKNCKTILPQEYIFFSGNDRYRPITRNRAYHIIKQAAAVNSIAGNISCHSLRKSFGYHAWKSGTPPALLMNVYNHSNMEITKRYLSIEQDDKDELFQAINL